MIDLCPVAASRLQTAALLAVKDLQRGVTVHLLLREEPSLMLQSLNLQLRHNLSWQISAEETGEWRVLIRHREDVAPRDLTPHASPPFNNQLRAKAKPHQPTGGRG